MVLTVACGGAHVVSDTPGVNRKGGRSALSVRQCIPDSGPRKKILFTLVILAIFRLGSIIPVPNVNVKQVDFCLKQATTGDTQGLYSLINLFSGGALLHLAVFALGIMPYITASIILQLLTVVIPRLEALKKEGHPVRRRSPSTPAI